MPEISPYFDAITAHRSMLIEDPLDASEQTISLETQAELAKDSFGVALSENFSAIKPYMRFLALEDRELLSMYYQAEKPQWALATYHRSTQTLCSQRLRLAAKRLAVVVSCGGDPCQEALEDVLEEHGLNRLVPGGPSTGRLVVEYRTRRSFSAVTDALRCPRPQARRALISSAATLMRDEHELHAAFGAYIHGLIDQASVQGTGYSDSRRMKCAHGFFVHPSVVGQERVGGDDCHAFGHILVSRASL